MPAWPEHNTFIKSRVFTVSLIVCNLSFSGKGQISIIDFDMQMLNDNLGTRN